ncbi:N-acyl-D-amino-acid deacylase family protein [Megasphaera cerevisiae]|uniref:N-acyl-D-amino-acid deacylase family protein n=1 Tax=Megasphaera cerevisiae TaxID=39029 RepID=UPI0009447533|nr:D-aminoacylase [Megasphaera cerevisiae]OKY53434.1 D-aminoacylase [Megasphaera cerevisiae]
MKTLFKNGLIIDGSGQQPYKGNILISEDTITAAGNVLIHDADLEIDLNGLAAAPGFIDTHSHSDLQVLSKPQILPKIMQGVTTEVLGQDGISMAPLPSQYIEPWRENLAGLDGESNDIDWHYATTANYLSMISTAQPGPNECYLVPHGNIRMEAMGLDDRRPTAAELQSMCRIVQREMESGAVGLSSGLIYMPCAYSHTQELIEICKVVAKYNGLFVVHQRSEADTILDSMKEIIEIGRQSGVQIHFSHFKVCGRKNWKYIDDMLRLLDEGKREGISISFDQYPYVAGSTMLGVILPPWVYDGGTEAALKRLKESSLRQRMIQDMEQGISGWDDFIDFAGLSGIYVTSVKHKRNENVIGLNLVQLGKLRNTDPYNATFDLLLDEDNAVGMVDFYGTEDHVKRFLQRPEMNACTDGLLNGKPHPRVYGAFPRILGKYVRKENTLSLPEAVYKMTKKAADTFHIHKRGQIQSGYYADLTIFNKDTVIDNGTFTNPMQYPSGIAYVMVNGIMAVEQGQYMNQRSGKVLRKQGREVKA